MSQATLPAFWDRVSLFCPVCDRRYSAGQDEWQEYCHRRRKHLKTSRDYTCTNPACKGVRLYPEWARWVALCDQWQGWNDEVGHGSLCGALARGEPCIHLSDFPCPLRKYGPEGIKHRYRTHEGEGEP